MEKAKQYPKKVYVQFDCDTNENRNMKVNEKPELLRNVSPIAVYELKKLVKVEMRPHIKDVKE